MQAYFYSALVTGQKPPRDRDSAFDQHVLACILSVARAEIETGRAGWRTATGLSAVEVHALMGRYFPLAAFGFFSGLDDVSTEGADVPETEEEMLCDLLVSHANVRTPLSPILARMIACRAMREDHLWQDLGLFDRGELSRMLARHFPDLAAGNTMNMKWKKYFYRALCEAEGFSLCTAPSCRECGDFDHCFGAESGESRMARLKNGLHVPATAAL